MKILTVEDNEINAKLMDYMLKDLNFEIAHSIAPDADNALKMTAESQFDLILMDINLGQGQLDGTEVMKLLKEKKEYQNVPIYAITCYALPGDKERFLNEGFDQYFSKPVDHPLLLKSIHALKE